MKRATKPTLDKKLIAAAMLIVLGEALTWITELFDPTASDFADFSSGVLLGLSVGMKLIGILLLVFRIVRDSRAQKSEQFSDTDQQ